MQNGRFVVLTGHLGDYPLSDLVGILRHQQKTGRLLIEYPKAPASFYFQDGELVDVQLDQLSGLQAICVALAQPPSNFNFNPLVRPSRRSVDNSLQRVVSELFGCWDESPLQIESTLSGSVLSEPVEPETDAPAEPARLTGKEVLALPGFVEPPGNQSRSVLVMTAAGIMMLGISSVIAVTGGFQGKSESATPEHVQVSTPRAASENAPEPKLAASFDLRRDSKGHVSAVDPGRRRLNSTSAEETAGDKNEATSPAPSAETKKSDVNKTDEGTQSSQLIDVVMQIENGRVLQASISNHKSGRGGYEAMALRIARQRRYPPKTNGQETVRIRVAQPE